MKFVFKKSNLMRRKRDTLDISNFMKYFNYKQYTEE